MSLKLCQLVHSPPNTDTIAVPFYSHIFEGKGRISYTIVTSFLSHVGWITDFPFRFFPPSLNYLDLFSLFVPLRKELGEESEGMAVLAFT
jgi:hypothetical protein